VCLLGAMSPGPSMVVVINNAVFKNRYHGILTSIGHGVGITVYAIFAVIGIGLIIKTNVIIFNSIKLLSIIFLIYLGVKSIFSRNKINFEKKDLKGSVTSFFEGFSISILNPKIFIWFVAIYSQFMSLNNEIIFNAYLVLTAGIVDTSWYVFLTFMATSKGFLNFIKSKNHILQKLIGYIFIILGILLLFGMYF
tara:strand:- start:2317 stop:2898 length:582 start_codon:yes stop_codon:yes gene_type:complete